MRVTARFYAFVSFVLAFFACRALDAGLRRVASAPARRAFLVAAAAVLLVEVFPKPVTFTALPQERDFPAVYHWLAHRQDVHAVLELPLRDDLTAVSYMYFGTLHWKPLVNGYSGYMPADYFRLRQNCCWPAPGGSTLDRLRNEGVSHILIHGEKRRQAWKWRGLADWEREEPVRLVYVAGEDRVYEILPEDPRRPKPSS
jgi:hypothetical protein